MDLSLLKVLVVDDSAFSQSAVFKTLSDFSIKAVTAAESGEEALGLLKSAIAKNTPFDLIICDWHMPGISGLDLLKICRDNTDYKNVPFVMITAKSEMGKAVIAMAAGADQYLVKPINTPDLKARIITAIDRRSSLKAAA
jgi:two-component system chemotaxis response regulator CheY